MIVGAWNRLHPLMMDAPFVSAFKHIVNRCWPTVFGVKCFVIVPNSVYCLRINVCLMRHHRPPLTMILYISEPVKQEAKEKKAYIELYRQNGNCLWVSNILDIVDV